MRVMLLRGVWDDNTSWEFVYASEVPDETLCTAVYCLAVLSEQNAIVLTRNHRGWEMLGGHIEPDETLEAAMLRECLEEGGFVPEQYRMFGYRKLTSKRPVRHSQRGGHYPFPVAYIPHFVAVSTRPLQLPHGQDIIEHRAFTISEIRTLKTEHLPIIHAGLSVYEVMRAAGSSDQLLT